VCLNTYFRQKETLRAKLVIQISVPSDDMHVGGTFAEGPWFAVSQQEAMRRRHMVYIIQLKST
jgi:hypothetical protein